MLFLVKDSNSNIKKDIGLLIYRSSDVNSTLETLEYDSTVPKKFQQKMDIAMSLNALNQFILTLRKKMAWVKQD